MSGFWIGVGLMVLGIVLLLVSRGRARQVAASGGSVAIGGDNMGNVSNVNVGGAHSQSHGHGLTYAAIGVELVGIAVTLWHAWHLASK